MLVRRWDPDYLLVHPMGLDYRGHRYGAGSGEYRRHATHLDELLAELVPRWRASGRTVVVTADHSHDEDPSHGVTSPDVRRVPVYALPWHGRRGRHGPCRLPAATGAHHVRGARPATRSHDGRPAAGGHRRPVA
ncbi:MAG: alkaline phosphatase family protein, partial [Actinomycetota bacterium]|nr:alkaline phosphatase family protein [Actinomycetota bacterium]